MAYCRFPRSPKLAMIPFFHISYSYSYFMGMFWSSRVLEMPDSVHAYPGSIQFLVAKIFNLIIIGSPFPLFRMLSSCHEIHPPSRDEKEQEKHMKKFREFHPISLLPPPGSTDPAIVSPAPVSNVIRTSSPCFHSTSKYSSVEIPYERLPKS